MENGQSSSQSSQQGKRKRASFSSPASAAALKKQKKAARSAEPKPLQECVDESTLHCVICMDFPSSEIYQCTNSHLLCASCHHRILESDSCVCPTCRVKLSRDSPVRNRVAETVVKNFVVPCSIAGCSQKVQHGELARHEAELCRYRQAKCKFHAIGCEWEGLAKTVKKHQKVCPLLQLGPKAILKRVTQRNKAAEARQLEAKEALDVQTRVSQLLQARSRAMSIHDVIVSKNEAFGGEMASPIFLAFGEAWEVTLEVAPKYQPKPPASSPTSDEHGAGGARSRRMRRRHRRSASPTTSQEEIMQDIYRLLHRNSLHAAGRGPARQRHAAPASGSFYEHAMRDSMGGGYDPPRNPPPSRNGSGAYGADIDSGARPWNNGPPLGAYSALAASAANPFSAASSASSSAQSSHQQQQQQPSSGYSPVPPYPNLAHNPPAPSQQPSTSSSSSSAQSQPPHSSHSLSAQSQPLSQQQRAQMQWPGSSLAALPSPGSGGNSRTSSSNSSSSSSSAAAAAAAQQRNNAQSSSSSSSSSAAQSSSSSASSSQPSLAHQRLLAAQAAARRAAVPQPADYLVLKLRMHNDGHRRKQKHRIEAVVLPGPQLGIKMAPAFVKGVYKPNHSHSFSLSTTLPLTKSQGEDLMETDNANFRIILVDKNPGLDRSFSTSHLATAGFGAPHHHATTGGSDLDSDGVAAFMSDEDDHDLDTDSDDDSDDSDDSSDESSSSSESSSSDEDEEELSSDEDDAEEVSDMSDIDEDEYPSGSDSDADDEDDAGDDESDDDGPLIALL